MATPAAGCAMGTPVSIKASEPPQTEAMDDEPDEEGEKRERNLSGIRSGTMNFRTVRLQHLRRQADGERIVVGQDGSNTILGQGTVAEIPSARACAASQTARLVGGVRREFVVKEKVFGLKNSATDGVGRFERVQCDGADDLCLAALEQGRAVQWAVQVGGARNSTDVRKAPTVTPDLLLQDVLAEEFLEEFVECLDDNLSVSIRAGIGDG